jgi:hypothetical protein
VSDKYLAQVLGRSEHIHELIKQSAEELSSINAGINYELATSDPLAGKKCRREK